MIRKWIQDPLTQTSRPQLAYKTPGQNDAKFPKNSRKAARYARTPTSLMQGSALIVSPGETFFTSSTVLICLSRGSMFPWEVSAVYSRRRIVCSVRRFLRLLFTIFETLTILLILAKSCALSMVHLPVQLSLVTRASGVCSSISARTRKNGNSSVKSA